MPFDFSEFQKQDFKAWETAAEKALKGKPLSGLTWQVDDVISMGPIYTPDQINAYIKTRDKSEESNSWYIGESFNGASPAETNDILLKALAFGLDSPLIFDATDFQTCLDQVRIDFLFPVYRSCDLDAYLGFIEKQDLEVTSLNGAFIVYEADYGDIDLTDSAADLKKVTNQLPQYYHSHLTMTIDPENIGASMGRHLYQLSELIHQLQELKIAPKIICEIECDGDFIKNISTIRALRKQIDTICQAYGISLDSVMIDTYIYQTAKDVQLAMIGASAQAVSAVSAGVDRLTIACESLDVQLDEEASRRMTRNVHHLMMMESGLHEIYDPLAGSYSIETLTSKIADVSWQVFQDKNK